MTGRPLWIGTFLNAIGASFVAVFLSHLAMVAWTARKKPTRMFDALVLTYFLLLLWVPLRLYSDWYLNFFTLEGFTDAAAVPVVAGLIVLIAIVLLLIQKPSAKFTQWLVGVEVALAAGLGIVAKIEPTVLWWIGDFIWNLNFVSRATLVFVSLLVVVLIVRNVVDQALPEDA